MIHHFLEQSAKAFPGKTALIHEDVRATYSEINNKANLLALWLKSHRVKIGDRVVLLLENSLEYVISYYGILKAGAVAVPLSTDTKAEGLTHFIGQLEPEVIIASLKFEKILQATHLTSFKLKALLLKNLDHPWPSLPFSLASFEDIINDTVESNLTIPIEESSLASIIYTSGSTGKPKGVMLSHENIVSNTHSICQYLHLTDKDIQMVVLPFFYVMGKSLLNTHFAVGGTVVINNRFAFAASVVKQMIDENVTGFSGVPSTYAYLLHRSPLASYRDKLDSLRYCSQAGGHMSRKIKEDLRRVLPLHTQIYIMYGATEASARLTYLEPESFVEKIDSIGKPIPGVILRVLGNNGKEVPTGQTGELVASGTNIMQGYWKDSQATTKVLDYNGYHTGDLGYKDEEGYFYVVGRNDNLLKVGGHRINPQEVEDAIMDTDLVMETVVLSVPDQLLGHRLIALACPKNEIRHESHILSLCAEKLPRYKLPSEIKLVRALPKSSNGKIDRGRCIDLISSV